MTDPAFLSALQRTTAGDLPLGELIGVAGGLAESGQADLACQLYKVWVACNPGDPQTYVALFNCACLESPTDEPRAIITLEKTIEANPDFLPAYINLGGLLERAGQAERAIELWTVGTARLSSVTGTAVTYKIAALKQLARVYGDRQQAGAAEAAMKECLALNPMQRDVLGQLTAIRLAQCKWPVAEPLDRIDRWNLVSNIHPLSMAAYTDDPLLQLAAAARYADEDVAAAPETLDDDRREALIDLANRRLRVGYISSDLREHAVGYLMSELFELHHRDQVEVFAYYCGIPSNDGLTQRTQRAVEHWVDIRGMSDEAAAQRIAQDGIDILVDVNGHTRDARTAVFARRPAPIQVNWLGYPGTMGTPYHQYMIADDWIVPPELEMYCSEKVLRLPCYQPNDRKRAVAPVRPGRVEAGLPAEGFVFCCFNGTQKITRFVFGRWMEILKRTPGSVLWLLAGAAEAQVRLGDMAEQHGIDRARLIFAPKLRNQEHLARYPLADLFLDTTPYGAHTTASDALWMGVPVLTTSGRCFAARVCGSLVRAAGLEDLVCKDAHEYVERAVALAGDPGQVAALKARLAAARDTCDLFNMDGLVERLEALYFAMARDHQQGLTPTPNLANLDAYFDVGVRLDHEDFEMSARPDYHELYRAGLARRHLKKPMLPDGRLWTAADLAADAFGINAPATPRRRRAAGATAR